MGGKGASLANRPHRRKADVAVRSFADFGRKFNAEHAEGAEAKPKEIEQKVTKETKKAAVEVRTFVPFVFFCSKNPFRKGDRNDTNRPKLLDCRPGRRPGSTGQRPVLQKTDNTNVLSLFDFGSNGSRERQRVVGCPLAGARGYHSIQSQKVM